MPYVYLIGWEQHNMYYYGTRYSEYANPSELWVTYKTSSKYVAQFAKLFGDPDLVEIRKVFTDAYEIAKQKALRWESKVLSRLGCVSRTDFLNRWDNNMVPRNTQGPFPFEDSEIQKKVDYTLRQKYKERGSASEDIKHQVYSTNIKKYNCHHTLNLPQVKSAREAASVEIYGTLNPFENNEKLKKVMIERHGVDNMMKDPEVKKKHAHSMKHKDWTERNSKTKTTNLERYGVSNPMNMFETQQKHKRSCPFGCKDNHKFSAGNFTNHMKKIHKWTNDQIKEYKDENQKDKN